MAYNPFDGIIINGPGVDAVNIQDGGNSITVDGNITSDFDITTKDAAGRLRVSIPEPLLSIKYRYNKLPLLVDEVSTGTSTFSSTNSCVAMSVTAGQYVVRQTFKRASYVSGIALNAEFTFSNFEVEANVTKRVGYFSSTTVAPYDSTLDGISLYNDGTTIRIQVYRSGTLVHDYAQASWYDPLDGTGPSGATVDWSKIQIAKFDFIWLGGGPIRLLMVFNNQEYLIHTMYTFNNETYPYMSSPNQPIRYEIRSTTGTGSFNQICSSVYSDDGGEINAAHTGYDFSINSGYATKTAPSVGVTYAMLGIRLNSSILDSRVLLRDMQALSSGNNFGLVTLVLNPTVAGTFTYNALTNTPINYAVGASTNTVTGGTVILSFILDRNLSSTVSISLAKILGSYINGTTETLVLCVTPQSNNLAWNAIMNLSEQI